MAKLAVTATVIFFLFALCHAFVPLDLPENEDVSFHLPGSVPNTMILLPSEKPESEPATATAVESEPETTSTDETQPKLEEADVTVTELTVPTESDDSVSIPLKTISFRPIDRHFRSRPIPLYFRHGHRCRFHRFHHLRHHQHHDHDDNDKSEDQIREFKQWGSKPIVHSTIDREVPYGNDMILSSGNEDSSSDRGMVRQAPAKWRRFGHGGPRFHIDDDVDTKMKMKRHHRHVEGQVWDREEHEEREHKHRHEHEHEHEHEHQEQNTATPDEELESLRSENRRLKNLLEQNLKLLQNLSESPSLSHDCPPDLYARLVATVDSEHFLARLKSLQQASVNGISYEFPFKEATDADMRSAEILIKVDGEEPSWWVWVTDEMVPSNVEEWSGIDDEKYVVVSEEHVVDGVANFMARCIMSNPKAQNLTPEELQKTVAKAVGGVSKLEKVLGIWHAGTLFYTLSTWGLALAGLYKTRAVFKLAALGVHTTSKVVMRAL